MPGSRQTRLSSEALVHSGSINGIGGRGFAHMRRRYCLFDAQSHVLQLDQSDCDTGRNANSSEADAGIHTLCKNGVIFGSWALGRDMDTEATFSELSQGNVSRC